MIKFNFSAEEYRDNYEYILYNHDKHILKEIIFKLFDLFKDAEIQQVKWSVCALEKDKATLFTEPEIHFKYVEYPTKWMKVGLGNVLQEVHEIKLPIFGLIKTLNFEKNSDCIIYELEILSVLFNWSNHFVNIGFFDKSYFWKKKPIENGENILYVELNSQNYIDAILSLIGDELFKAETKKELLEFALLEKKSKTKKSNKI